jgi:glyoxylase-like metal-dependent hydrolase (beta-lactamase superfamily II)
MDDTLKLWLCELERREEMSGDIFRFKVGTFACAIVNDGTYTYQNPGKSLFENAPQEALATALQEYGIELESWTEYISPYPSLVVDTGEYLVLVDTGMGARVPTTGQLLDNLQAAGFQPSDFDVIVLTHIHPDHAGGTIDSSGRPAFPNARYVLWQREWDFWTKNPDVSKLRDDHFVPVMLDTAERFLPPIKEQVDFVEPETEIVPGITAIAAPGHTPGQVALIVASAGEQLLVLADAVLHPVQIEWPEWIAPVDLLVDETVATRRHLLGRAATEKMLVFAPHFDFPSLGRVGIRGNGWCWVPQEQEISAR